MTDILLLVGVALCALSILLAIIAVAQTRAPRGAAIALVLGMLAVFSADWMDDRPLGTESVLQSWARLTGAVETAPAEAPAVDPAPVVPAPQTAPVATPVTEPATSQPSQ